MTVDIRRKRYVIIKDGVEIFCGLSQRLHFKPMSDIGNATIKTYQSKDKALFALKSSYYDITQINYEIVEVDEVISNYRVR